MEWFLKFESWIYKMWGYNAVIHFEDVMVFLGGIFIGMVIMVFLSGKVVFKLHKIKDLGNKVKLIKFKKDNGEQNFIADPQNVSESVETLLIVIFRPLCTIKEYTLRDERRTKFLIITLLLIGVVVLFLAAVSIITVFDPHV